MLHLSTGNACLKQPSDDQCIFFKDFIFIHASANLTAAATVAVRGAFEYQGQKCSAASRLYVPKSVWSEFKTRLLKMIDRIKVGPAENYANFVNAVMAAFEKITSYIEQARLDEDARTIAGGSYDDSSGYFIHPTLIEARTPDYTTMREELFGPVLTVYVYDENCYEETLHQCERTSA